MLLLCLMVTLSSPVLASRARMQALGQDTGIGSFYIDDTRNIFHNPANLSNGSDYVLAEWNDNATNSTTGDGEGGIFRDAGSMNYGLYFGADVDQRTQNVARTANSYTKSDDMLDLFLAGNAGMDWGLRVNYGKHKVAAGTNTAYGLGLGVNSGDLSVYSNLDISNKTESSSGKFEGDFGYNVGLIYDFMGMTGWLNYTGWGYEITPTSGTKTERTLSKIQAGLGRIIEVSNTSRVFTDLDYYYQNQEDKTTATVKTKTRAVNVNIGFEADATSWLTWRGSVKQDLTSEVTGAVETAGTYINAGSTLNFGKLKVDGTIGTASGKVGSNDFLSQVGVHYWF